MKLLLIIVGLLNGFVFQKIYDSIHSATFPIDWTSLKNLWKVVISTLLSSTTIGVLWVWPVFVFDSNSFPDLIVGSYKIHGYILSILVGAALWRIYMVKSKNG